MVRREFSNPKQKTHMIHTKNKKPAHTPTNFSELFPGSFLKAVDLAGQPHVVTIAGLSQEELNGESKNILSFEEFDAGLVLNVTNGRAIADLFGDALADWTGQQIELFPTRCEFSGKMVDAIRVRAVRPPPAAPARPARPAAPQPAAAESGDVPY